MALLFANGQAFCRLVVLHRDGILYEPKTGRTPQKFSVSRLKESPNIIFRGYGIYHSNGEWDCQNERAWLHSEVVVWRHKLGRLVNNNSTFFGIVSLCTYISLFAFEWATNNWSKLKAYFLTPNPQCLEHFGEFIGRILKISNYIYFCNWNWKPIFWEHNAQCSL